jgi:hypothetical protein
MVKKRTPARMARLVAQWRASGESGAAFARRHHVPAWTFWYWCRKVPNGPLPGPEDARPAAFVPVQVTPASSEHDLEVVWPGGERLRVGSGASADLVRAVVSALRSPC